MPKSLPEPVVDQMAKELAKFLAPLYPKLEVEQLEEESRRVILGEAPVMTICRGKPLLWPGATVISIPVAWYDLEMGRAKVGDVWGDGPRWLFEEAADA
jgi:hypothetical protein